VVCDIDGKKQKNTQLELNSNSILKKEIQIGVENSFVFFIICEYDVEKKAVLKTHIQKDTIALRENFK
jgi:hypothetical protein